MIGRPSVTFTAVPNAACLSTGSPWSWNMASAASAPSSMRGVKSVSAGKGPDTASPSAARSPTAGAMTSISSRPRWPDSPACGLRPATRIRGRAMPKRRRRSASRMRTTETTSERVIAAGTAESGMCVVASATRMPPPASSITTCGVPVRSARYSVWPVKAIPASLMTLFWTGAVTIAWNSPLRQPSRARSRRPSTWRALRGSRRPAVTGCGAGMESIEMGGAASRPGYSGTSKAIPRDLARAATTSRSPRITTRPGKERRAMDAQRSGPMPAGSPAVRATRAVVAVTGFAGGAASPQRSS